MLIDVHKRWIHRIAVEELQGLRVARQLARVTFGENHQTVRDLDVTVRFAEQAVANLEAEPTRRAA